MRSRFPRSLINVGLLVLVNLCWAAQWTAYKLIGDCAGPITISVLTFLIAMPTIFPLYMAERLSGKQVPSGISHDQRSLWRWNNMVPFLVAGVLGIASASVFGAWGTARTTAANASLLNLTIPIVTALLAAAILHERMTAVRWASLGIALAGVLLLSIQAPESAATEGLVVDWGNLGLMNKDFALGNLLVLISCTGSCLYNVCSKGLLSRFSPLEVLFYGYLLALAASVTLMLWLEPTSPQMLAAYGVRAWIGLALVGGVSFGVAMVLWLFLLTRLDVSQASVSVYLMPFFGVLLAAVVLHETISLAMIIGGVITLGGTILVVSTEGRDLERATASKPGDGVA